MTNFTILAAHIEVFNTENSHIDVMLEVLSSQNKSQKLNESFTMKKSQNKGRKKK